MESWLVCAAHCVFEKFGLLVQGDWNLMPVVLWIAVYQAGLQLPQGYA